MSEASKGRNRRGGSEFALKVSPKKYMLGAGIIAAVMLIAAFINYDYRKDCTRRLNEENIFVTVPKSDFIDTNGNRISGLEMRDGVLTATANENFIVIGDRTILDAEIKTITLDVSGFEGETETKLYLLDTYERYDFPFHNGKCDVRIKEGSNDGAPPALVRIDLPISEGESVTVNSVIFNEPTAYAAAVKDESADMLGRFFAPAAMLLAALYALTAGIRKRRPHIAETAVAFAGTAVCAAWLHFGHINVYTLAITAFAAILLMESAFYYVTEYALRHLSKLKFIRAKHVFAAFALILGLLLYSRLAPVFLIIAFYPAYLLGWFKGGTGEPQKNVITSMIAAFVCAALCFAAFWRIESVSAVFGALSGSEPKIYLAAGAFLSLLAAACVLASSGAGEFKEHSYDGAFMALPFALGCAFACALGVDISSSSLFIMLAVSFAAGIVFNEYAAQTEVPLGDAVFDGKEVKALLYTVLMQLVFIALTVFFEIMVNSMLSGMTADEIKEHLHIFLFSPVFLYNILLLNCVYAVIISVIGRGIGNILFSLANLTFFIINYIKLRYHDTMFKPGDIMQIGDALAIIRGAMHMGHMILLALVIAAAVTLAVVFRKHLKPHFSLVLLISSLALTGALFGYISKDRLDDIGITTVDKWLDDKIRMDRQGFYIYTYLNARTIADIIPHTPQGYSREYMQGLKTEFDGLKAQTEVSEQKPDVIMLMLESAFDVEAVPGVTFNKEVETNIKKYRNAEMISPRYGGGTANIEFEALTGFSTYFMENSVVPYVTYWNSEDNYIPSLAWQFGANGYDTVAIHPNDEGFYNRKNVYASMGFDDFVSIEDMPEDIKRNRRGYVYNSEMLNIMFNLIEADDAPLFMFALNIENHNPYTTKDNNADVEAEGENISESEKTELSVYAQTLSSDDRMIGEIIDYMNKTDRPTILYVWGDHLPALGYFASSGYINEINDKYRTPIIMYSNYKDIEPDAKLVTPNQLAAQAIRDSGIEHDSYFDYIYSLREDHPVIQREFMNGDDDRINKYKMLQYDQLFGENYLEAKREE